MLLLAHQASAELMLYPTRIVFEGNQRSAQIQLINNGSESITYRIALVNRRMNEVGGFESVEQPLPDEQFADDMLRYSPRQVTLAPGVGQTVRIMVRKPTELAVGEYRSHLLFTQQPQATGRHSVETRGAPEKNIGVVLTTLVGASIPVIIRHGKTTANLTLANLDFQHPAGQAPMLSLSMERNGTQSVYGDLAVSFTPKGGKEKIIGRANGVAVYTPNSSRRARLPLDSSGEKLANGSLRVTFREQAEDGGKLLAEAVLLIP